ncbi:hypothetical protein ACH4VR_41275 [Streptomyces sp. NPDC020883]|uniref:hypothetical protein n=1 Tax=Streptomyces sp. NPDC020883 TaxID=3365099 RepID=UPI00379B41B6
MTARDDLIRCASTTRTVTADGLAPYLDRFEVETRADERKRVADELRLADRPVFPDGERPDLIASTMRNIHVRIARDGHDAPYWTPGKRK